MKVQKRVYLIPLFRIALKGYPTPMMGVILQRKRMCSPQWAFLEGTASFIGGGIDPGESPVEAVIREAQEEVGLTLKEEQLVKTWEDDRFVYFSIYLGKLAQADFQKLAGANTEGVLDWALIDPLAPERWMETGFLEAIRHAVQKRLLHELHELEVIESAG